MGSAELKMAQSKQPQLFQHFMRVIARQRLSHAYLFTGEAGSGKLALAQAITMRLFCQKVQNGEPCGKCNECLRIAKHEHPDVLMIHPQGATIHIDQIRLLRTEFTKTAMEGHQKVFIIDQADKMTTSAANSLLKFIEEPQGNVTCFLLTRHLAAILPTIISRTQVVKFPELAPPIFFKALKHLKIKSTEVNLLAALTNRIETARSWEQDQWFGKLQTSVEQWFQKVVRLDYTAFPDVQIKLMPLVRNRDQQVILLQMLLRIWCDVLDLKYEDLKKSQIHFPDVYADLRQVAQQIPEKTLLAVINLMLENHQLLHQNINFQNILETQTLKILLKLQN